MAKPFLCKLGFHETFNSTSGTNIGTKETPMWVLHTTQVCNKCGWRSDGKTK